jgi:pyruvate decarboxylase
VSIDLLRTPIDLGPKSNESAQEKAVSAILNALTAAKNPSLLIDAFVQRFGASSEANELMSKLNVPTFAAPMGKGVVDETHEMYVGVYSGNIGPFGVADIAKKSDLAITLGYCPADTNSGGFSRKYDENKVIHINPFDVVVNGQTYLDTYIKPLLQALIAALPTIPIHSVSKPQLPSPRDAVDIHSSQLTQSQLWPLIQSFLQPHDILVGETGTANFGIYDLKFPSHVRYASQIYYGSIGWATPATLGAEMARLEEGKSEGRTVLITGDGSLALTIQEIGTMIKADIKPIIIVLNNGGYTVERMIWGAREGI